MRTVLDIEHLLQPDNLAAEIANKWVEYDSFREKWKREKVELRNYLYATDTSSTSNARLDWSNSTTTPKLTQIYDNLKANYTAALFPNEDWMRWEGDDADGVTKKKVDAIQDYMETKLRQSKFRLVADRLVDDFILYGNCFATVEFETNYNVVGEEVIPGYIGPKTRRISPYDIVFDPTAASFEKSPKIIRDLIGLGEMKKLLEKGDTKWKDIFDKALGNRAEVASANATEKSDAFVADGFNSIEHYYGSSYMEVLTFYGDIFDINEKVLKSNRRIIVVDRAYVILDEEIPSWLGETPVYHAGWRNRPDNLWAMGPLDNLVGMQYRIDHLENLKADVFDQIALPMLKIKGEVEDFVYEPGGRIYMGEEGDVAPLVPDSTALQADFQIQVLEQKMEELAGAPRQAMGIRTPGEKTAFEVQTLENSASRIFQHKAAQFEMMFIEPLLNAMLESAKRNMDTSDLIRSVDDATGAILFTEVTRADITARGKITPVGARHFAERAQRIQNLNQVLQIKLGDPTIGAHLSGKEIAKIISYELGEETMYGENIAVYELAETQEAQQNAEADLQENLGIAAQEGL